LGGAGFIGRWVARRLSAYGAILTLPVLSTAAAQSVFSFYGVQGEAVQVDLSQPGAIRDLLASVRPAITFNLAGYGVNRSERDETMAYEINANLIDGLCEAVLPVKDGHWPGQDIVHVGSALEYGAIGGDLAETSVPNPTTLYGRSKLAGTLRLAQHCRTQAIKGLTARLFTVYGPGEYAGRLMPSLLEAARSGEALPLTAGTQKRDFTYVEDVAEGLLRLGLATADPGEAVNLATGRLTTVKRFAETAARILGIQRAQLHFGALPTRVEEMEHSEVAIGRLRRLTSWTPEAAIAEGIRRTAEFHNKQVQGD
jgi:nucleoside-diphosphate-sugar epimerase